MTGMENKVREKKIELSILVACIACIVAVALFNTVPYYKVYKRTKHIEVTHNFAQRFKV